MRDPLRLAWEGAKSRRRAPMLRSRLIGRGDREQRPLVERKREKFHRDRKLVGLGPDQAAAVWIGGVGHAIVDLAGEARRHDDGGEAALGAEVHRPAGTGATPQIEVGLQRGFVRLLFGVQF
jgi:hypothetical protein